MPDPTRNRNLAVVLIAKTNTADQRIASTGLTKICALAKKQIVFQCEARQAIRRFIFRAHRQTSVGPTNTACHVIDLESRLRAGGFRQGQVGRAIQIQVALKAEGFRSVCDGEVEYKSKLIRGQVETPQRIYIIDLKGENGSYPDERSNSFLTLHQ